MIGWTCTLVAAFPVAIVAAISEWLGLGGYAECSHVPVDVDRWERRRKSACEVLLMLFFGLERHAGWQVQHCGDYSSCCPS